MNLVISLKIIVLILHRENRFLNMETEIIRLMCNDEIVKFVTDRYKTSPEILVNEFLTDETNTSVHLLNNEIEILRGLKNEIERQVTI